MRIIAGKYRGTKLFTPGSDNTYTRPMLDRVREALFNILSSRVEGAEVLDLCSGTGSIGLEALSRGASMTTFVEKSSRNRRTIERNITKLGVESQTNLIGGTLPRILKTLGTRYNLIFFDPPFDSKLPEECFPFFPNLLAKDHLIVVERRKGSEDQIPNEFQLIRRHQIGDSVLLFYDYGRNST